MNDRYCLSQSLAPDGLTTHTDSLTIDAGNQQSVSCDGFAGLFFKPVAIFSIGYRALPTSSDPIVACITHLPPPPDHDWENQLKLVAFKFK